LKIYLELHLSQGSYEKRSISRLTYKFVARILFFTVSWTEVVSSLLVGARIRQGSSHWFPSEQAGDTSMDGKKDRTRSLCYKCNNPESNFPLDFSYFINWSHSSQFTLEWKQSHKKHWKARSWPILAAASHLECLPWTKHLINICQITEWIFLNIKIQLNK
jgi:hypothetical protein